MSRASQVTLFVIFLHGIRDLVHQPQVVDSYIHFYILTYKNVCYYFCIHIYLGMKSYYYYNCKNYWISSILYQIDIIILYKNLCCLAVSTRKLRPNSGQVHILGILMHITYLIKFTECQTHFSHESFFLCSKYTSSNPAYKNI